MFVRSTGLGRTLLTARVSKIVPTNIVPSTLEPPKDGEHEPTRLLMELEITHPVHWTVRAFVDPPDLRQMIIHVLKNPSLILHGIKFLFIKGPKYDQKATETSTEHKVPTPKAPDKTAPTIQKGPSPIPVRTKV